MQAASRLPSVVEGIASPGVPDAVPRASRRSSSTERPKKSPLAAPRRLPAACPGSTLPTKKRERPKSERRMESTSGRRGSPRCQGGRAARRGAGVEEDRVGGRGQLGGADEGDDHRRVGERSGPARARQVRAQHGEIEDHRDQRAGAGDGEARHRGELDEQAAGRPRQRGAMRPQGAAAMSRGPRLACGHERACSSRARAGRRGTRPRWRRAGTPLPRAARPSRSPRVPPPAPASPWRRARPRCP